MIAELLLSRRGIILSFLVVLALVDLWLWWRRRADRTDERDET